jgi:hypothetical protein
MNYIITSLTGGTFKTHLHEGKIFRKKNIENNQIPPSKGLLHLKCQSLVEEGGRK